MIRTTDRLLQRFADGVRATYEPNVDDPWYYDNAAHLVSGAIIGASSWFVLDTGIAGSLGVFLVLALVWEWFEWSYNVRPWDDREDWDYDRAVEDTLLDTYVGATGTVITVWLLVAL